MLLCLRCEYLVDAGFGRKWSGRLVPFMDHLAILNVVQQLERVQRRVRRADSFLDQPREALHQSLDEVLLEEFGAVNDTPAHTRRRVVEIDLEIEPRLDVLRISRRHFLKRETRLEEW